MFWGLIMEPGRCYTQTVKVSFHVSMAALDISNSSDEPSQIMCVFEGRNYLLCTLNKKDKLQCPLDLNFEAGTKVSFATNGKSHVHLTGYLTTMEDEFGEEEQEEEEEEETAIKKEKKRAKKELKEGPPKKKTKISKLNSISSSAEDVEEEESSDSDFLLDNLEEEEDVEEEGEDEEDEDEGEEEESSMSEAESEEEQETAKPKQNGIAKTNSAPKQKKKGKAEKPQNEKVQKVQEQKEKSTKQENKKEQKQPKQAKKTVLKGGIVAQDLVEGTGEAATAGKFATVYYQGYLKDSNKMFDSTTKGPGFSFRLGKGEVIKGWDIGLVGMKVGGKRRLMIPPKVAYGAKGSPPVIPPNAYLIFEVELKKLS